MTNAKLLARNTVLNIIGQGIPIFAAVFCIPGLVQGLGIERFGVLSLSWVVIGYFSLFDLGMGRALTKLVAEKLGKEQKDELSPLIWTTLIVMMIMGLLGAAVLVALSSWMIQSMLKIPAGLQAETLLAFCLLAATIPLVISTSALSGILAALQRFDLINYIRAPMGVLNYVGPLLILPYSKSLITVVSILASTRLLAWLIHGALCFKIIPSLRNGATFQRALVRPLLEFGSWITVGGIIGPLTMYFDRFIIGTIVSIASVAYYTTPFDMVTKIFIISNAMSAVLFPAFSYSFSQNHAAVKQIYHRGIKYLFLFLFPILATVTFFAKDLLTIWLGAAFALHSFRALQIIALGTLMLSVESIPYALIQGVGQPDIPVKLNLIELPFYLIAIWWFTKMYGINGAALAWTLRAGIDMLLLLFFTSRLLMEKNSVYYEICLFVVFSLVVFLFAMISLPFYIKLSIWVIVTLVYIYLLWIYFLNADERQALKSKLNFVI